MCRNKPKILKKNEIYWYKHKIHKRTYRELPELLLRRRRRTTGLLERRRGLRRLGGERLRYRGGDLQRGGGRLIGGDGLRICGRIFGNKTGAAVISCPSICPPSMCFIAFSASSGFEYSTYAIPRPFVGCHRSTGNSTCFTSPKQLNISQTCSLVTFRVNRPI